MQLETAKFFFDVVTACELIEKFTSDKTYTDFESDEMLRAAVERQFITVGEALMQARKLNQDSVASITSVVKIIGFRNVLVHGYGIIQPPTVWSAVQKDVAVLKREVQTLLATAPAP